MVPAAARAIVCHFLRKPDCENYLTQLGPSDSYRTTHNSVYETRRKRGHGAHFRECADLLGRVHVIVCNNAWGCELSVTKFTQTTFFNGQTVLISECPTSVSPSPIKSQLNCMK